MPGEVIEAALELTVDALADVGSAGSSPRRRRSGCLRLFLAIVTVALVVGVVIAFGS